MILLGNSFPRWLFVCLVLLAVGLTIGGYVNSWVPEKAAGLALTGFELPEWIKFTPQVRDGSAPLRRADFYWPPVAAAVAVIALIPPRPRSHGLSGWLGLAAAALLGMLPVPLWEDIQALGGLRANWQRVAMVAGVLLLIVIRLIRPRLGERFFGLALFATASAGLLLLTRAFSAAEPLVENLLNHFIDPTLGYQLARVGMLALALAGLVQLVQKKTAPAWQRRHDFPSDQKETVSESLIP